MLASLFRILVMAPSVSETSTLAGQLYQWLSRQADKASNKIFQLYGTLRLSEFLESATCFSAAKKEIIFSKGFGLVIYKTLAGTNFKIRSFSQSFRVFNTVLFYFLNFFKGFFDLTTSSIFFFFPYMPFASAKDHIVAMR